MSEAPYARSTVKHFLPTLLDFADRLDLLLGVSSHRFLYFEKRFKFNFWIRMGRGGGGGIQQELLFSHCSGSHAGKVQTNRLHANCSGKHS